MLILSGADVERLIDHDRLLEALGGAMADLSAGRATMPNRVAALVPGRDGLLAAMPAYVPGSRALTTKLVSVFPRNTSMPTHQAVICVFDPDTGTPVALLDGTSITAARTAAGSALATRLLARADAEVVAVLGTGVQARAHIVAMARSWPTERFLIAGRSVEAAVRLADEMRPMLPVPVEVVSSFDDAVARADIVCATTHSPTPVVMRRWLRSGTHVNSVGYRMDGVGEVDADTVADARVVVEWRAATLAPPPAGAVELQGIETAAEIGELVAGSVAGRTSPDELTLYKSVGVAVQDAVAAALVIAAARTAGAGTEIAI